MIRLRKYQSGVDPALTENGDDLYIRDDDKYRVLNILGEGRDGFVMAYYLDKDSLVTTVKVTGEGGLLDGNVVMKHDDSITFKRGDKVVLGTKDGPYFANVSSYGPLGFYIDLLVRSDRGGNILKDLIDVERDLSAHFVHRCNSGQETEFSDLIKDRCGDETWREYFGPKCDFKPFDKVLMRNKGVIPGKWFPSFFSHEEDGTYYDTSGVAFKECIPYEGNEELTMTDKEPL